MKFMDKINKVTAGRQSEKEVSSRVDSLLGVLGKEVMSMFKDVKSKEALLDRMGTTPQKFYEDVLSELEKKLSSRISIWKKTVNFKSYDWWSSAQKKRVP